MIWTILLIIPAIAFLIYKYLVYQSEFWKRRGIPGPPSELFFGNSRELYKYYEPAGLKYYEWTKKYGKVYGFREGSTNILMTSDIDMITDVFVKQFDNFHSRRDLTPITQDVDTKKKVHLVEARGGRWKRLRNLSTPSFTVSSLKKMQPIVDDTASRMVDLMERHADGEPFDCQRYFFEFTLDIVCRLVLGQKESTLFQNDRFQPIQDLFLSSQDVFVLHLTNAIPALGRFMANIFDKFNIQLNNTAKRIFDEIETAVKDRAKQIEQNGSPEEPADFIDVFLSNASDFDYKENGEDFSLQDSVAKTLTVDEVVMQAIVLLFGGYDTTANALSYTAWMLSKHPKVMRKCQEEIDEVSRDQSISYEDGQKLRYLDAVCKETLRFYPLAARNLGRKCMKDTKLGDYEIPKGVVVFADTYAVHFSKELWGEDADEFRPERWLERSIPAMQFLTFGGGPRVCIGLRLAAFEEKLVLAHLLRRFDIIADEKTRELKLIGSLTMTAESVPIKIKARI